MLIDLLLAPEDSSQADAKITIPGSFCQTEEGSAPPRREPQPLSRTAIEGHGCMFVLTRTHLRMWILSGGSKSLVHELHRRRQGPPW